METSAAKRRKVSPQAAVAVAQNESTTPQDPPRARPARASYASPTKSSLSRHNPDILQRRQASPSKPSADAGGPEAQTSTQEPEPLTALLERQLQEDEQAATSRQTGDSNHDDGTRRGPSEGPDNLSRSPARKLGGGLASRPRRSLNKAFSRPGPPDEAEELLNPFLGRALRRSPLGGGIPRLEPEPELPPTPERPPDTSTPPTGILNNTPSRRPRRSKALAEQLSSSPAKRPPTKADPTGGDGLPSFDPPVPLSLEPLDKQQQGQSNKDTGSKPPPPSSIRGVEPDADYEKRRQREALLAEVEQLEHDLGVVARENERVRKSRADKRQVSASSNRDEILDVLRRHVPPSLISNKDKPDRDATDWIQTALNPIALLPFSKPSSLLSPALFPEETDEEEKEIASHHPIPMTADEALPFLQVFTPLAFTSDIQILPQEGDDSPLLQRHSITVSSTVAPGFFSARIEMTVDTQSHAITELAVPRIDPAAAAELGPFIEQVTRGAGSSALSNNISVLAWSMGEWLRVAMRRAKTWRVLDGELGSKEGLAEVARTMRARAKGRKTRRGAESDSDEDEYVAVHSSSLLPYLGRKSMDFEIPAESEETPPSLRIQWRIEFDRTGEARSRIEALVGLPGKWHRQDERGRLAGIPALFDELIRADNDVVGAVRTTVALLAGDQ